MKGWKSLAATAALATFAAACGSDSPTAPQSQSKSLDLATIFSQMSMGNADAMPGARAASGIPFSGTAPVPTSASCAYSDSAQGFTCAPVTSHGITFTVSYWLYDAAGHGLSTLDATKIASVRTVTDAAGTLSLSGAASGEGIALTQHTDMTLSGILTSARTLNGKSASHYDFTFSPSTPVHSVMDDSSVTTNVVIPAQPTDGEYWPTSGTIASDMHMTTTSQSLPPVPIESHVVITFTGTSLVKFTMSSLFGGGSSTCTIDLSGKTPPVCS